MNVAYLQTYYEKIKKLIKTPSFHILFSSAAVAIIFLAGDLVFTRRFTQEDFGTWRQLMLLVTLGATLISLGMPEGYRYFISYDSKNTFRHALSLITTTFLIALILQSILVLGGMNLIAKAFNNESLHYFLYSLPVIFVIVTLSRAIRYLMINNKHTKELYRYSIYCIIISFILIACTWPLYEKLSAQYFWWWMSGLVMMIYLVLFLPYIFVFINQKKQVHWKEAFKIKPYLRVGFPIYIATFVGVITLNLDKGIVSAFTDPVVFAIYSIGAIELPVVGMIGASIMQKIFPDLVSSYRKGNASEAKNLWLQTTLKSTRITVPIILLMMIFSKPLIEFLFTQKYVDAVPVFQTYLLVGLWRNTQYGALIIASGKTKWTFYYSVAGLIFNIIVSLLLFYLFGVIGIAWGGFLSVTFLSLLQLRHEGMLTEWRKNILMNKAVFLQLVGIIIVYLIYNVPF
jgi:O-antigen/teichoic acid export membrane protein